MLRAEGLCVRAELSPRKLGRQLESASREHAHFAVIIGDELADGHVQLKDLEAGTQHLVPLDALAKDLARAAKSHHHG
jgi:histidyl-tRNA synthetase